MPRGKYTRGRTPLPETAGDMTARRMEERVDRLSTFETFEAEVLPRLQAMLKAGKTSAEMRAWAQAYVTAKQISIALKPDVKDSDALKAIDAITHQNEGRPTERHEHKHQLENLSDQELDAVLASKLANAAQAASTKKPSH